MSYQEYYEERARQALREAMQTELPNVRAQYMKAAATWSALAAHKASTTRSMGFAAQPARTAIAENP